MSNRMRSGRHAAQAAPGALAPGNERGIALMAVFFVLVLVFLLATALSTDIWSETQFTAREEGATKALYAAEAGIAFGEDLVWNQYLAQRNGAPGPMGTYTAYLDQTGVAASVGAQPVPVPVAALDGMTNIQQILIERRPNGDATDITITATGADMWGNAETIVERLRVQQGGNQLDFGLLAKDVSCLYCHMEIDNVDRYYNGDANEYGNFPRVKAAALETAMIRPNRPGWGSRFFSADTRIAGTMYFRGHVINRESGTEMTQGEFVASTLDAYEFDSTDLNITQEGTGAMTQVNLHQAPSNNGQLQPGANLYLDYPSDPALQVDGYLPDTVPPLFPDLNGNRVVDPNEIQERMDAVYAEFGYRGPGSISGGVIYTVPHGGTYTNGSLPVSGNTSSIHASGGVYEGNVILSGSPGDPLVVDDTVVIDGDVIIQGVVSGFGQIYASGNIYVTGDIEYADGVDANGNRTFGQAADGSANGLMLKAGGNFLINDFLTPERLFDSDGNLVDSQNYAPAQQDIENPTVIDTGDHLNGGDWSFATGQMALFNRLEWQRTQPLLPNAQGRLEPNSTYDPDYIPRYQVMGPGDPVYIYGGRHRDGGGTWQGTYWDDRLQIWRGDETPYDYHMHEDRNYNGVLDPGEDLNGDDRLDTGDLIMLTQAEAQAIQSAGVVQYTPNGGWLGDENLKRLWLADHAMRAVGKPLTIDAGMETDGTIFVLARDWSRYRRRYRGQTLVNGVIVANNVGMLSPADYYANVGLGLRLNYDSRLGVFDGDDGSAPVSIQLLAREYR